MESHKAKAAFEIRVVKLVTLLLYKVVQYSLYFGLNVC